MLFAVLDFSDYAAIAVIVILFASGSAAYAAFRTSDAVGLARMERKIDALLRHLHVEYVDPASPDRLSDEVRMLANDPAKKIHAIKLHREQTGLGLKEAKDAVEGYMSRRT